MNGLEILAALAALFAFVYLVWALLRAEQL